MQKLTKSQQKVYDYLLDCQKNGILPSVREICEATGFKSTSSVHAHLKALEKYGYITRKADLARGITVNNFDGTPSSIAVSFVKTDSFSKTGFPIDENERCAVVDESFKTFGKLYALRIVDDSMINEGILKGDAVVFARTSEVSDGSLAVVVLDGTVCVRRFFLNDDGTIKLCAANTAYEDISCEQVKVIGKIVTLIRNFT